jgi:metallophosphoesterase (TIGR03768 family)
VKKCVAAACLLSLVATASVLARSSKSPTYPIASDVYTTLDRTVVATPPLAVTLDPCDIAEYTTYHYGQWDWDLDGFAYITPDPNFQGTNAVLSVPDPCAATLLSFFSMSDVHIADKESPAQAIYIGYRYPYPSTPGPNSVPIGDSSSYSAVILYTTHVLDAAVQTINAVHQQNPFDFGLALGDAANNTQYNELRWYLDVIDGKKITPSSGAHLGAKTVDFQKSYQAAGLDKSIPWYQAIGNHDQFWMGSAGVTDYIRKTYVGSDVLNIGLPASLPPDFNVVLNQRGYYTGLVDGLTGNIIDAWQVADFSKPPKIAADRKRRSLTMQDWMRQFFNTTTKPVGHGFTKQMVKDSNACYSFHPKANIPIKVIVLDDTDKVARNARAALDQKRYNWLVNELDAGEDANELMIICSHIPIRPYEQQPPVPGNPYAPFMTVFSPDSNIPEQTLLDKLHTYRNLILWIAGHVHRNAITPQAASNGDPNYGFWEVETPSLRDFPQQFRRFDIVRNSDNTISIFTHDVDTAVNMSNFPNNSASPALTSRSYAVATQEIFNNEVQQGPNVDPCSGVYNAELIKHISPAMQAKVAQIVPVVASFTINGKARSTRDPLVTLAGTITGSTAAYYMASEAADFNDASWLPYAKALSFMLSPGPGAKTVYFKVKDGSGAESAVAHKSIVLKRSAGTPE